MAVHGSHRLRLRLGKFPNCGRALRKHVDRATLGQIIEDLQDVPGNKRLDAVERLCHELMVKREVPSIGAYSGKGAEDRK